MRKFVAILLGAILVVTQVAAQNKTIKGRVTEDGKKPLSNASIIVKGTTVAAKQMMKVIIQLLFQQMAEY